MYRVDDLKSQSSLGSRKTGLLTRELGGQDVTVENEASSDGTEDGYSPSNDPKRPDAQLHSVQQPSMPPTLISALGLEYNPFARSYSEGDPAVEFDEIYVDYTPSLLDRLHTPQSACVYADYGMGKTATRMALEFAVRSTYTTQPTLCLTYTPKPDVLATSWTLARHAVALARSAPAQLIAQVLERPDEYTHVLEDKTRHAALIRQARALPTGARRAVREAIIQQTTTNAIWPGELRTVRRMAPTEQWWTLARLIAAEVQNPGPTLVSWQDVIDDARALGFADVFVLVDAIDENEIDRTALLQLVEPLLNATELFEEQHIFLKYFLPLDLHEVLVSSSINQKEVLTWPGEIVTIEEVPPKRLEEMVIARLQAASASSVSIRSLDWLGGTSLNESIQARLAQIARGSPRQMITLADALLQFHSDHGFQHEQRLWMTEDEWQQFVSRYQDLPPH